MFNLRKFFGLCWHEWELIEKVRDLKWEVPSGFASSDGGMHTLKSPYNILRCVKCKKRICDEIWRHKRYSDWLIKEGK